MRAYQTLIVCFFKYWNYQEGTEVTVESHRKTQISGQQTHEAHVGHLVQQHLEPSPNTPKLGSLSQVRVTIEVMYFGASFGKGLKAIILLAKYFLLFLPPARFLKLHSPLTFGRIFNVRGHNLISETARQRWLCSLYHLLRAHYVLSTKYFTYISFLNHYSNLMMQRVFIAPCSSSDNWGLERLSHLNNWQVIQKRSKSRCLGVKPLLFLYPPASIW